jgi:hypothetical protein
MGNRSVPPYSKYKASSGRSGSEPFDLVVDDQNRVNLFSVATNTDARIRTVHVALADTQPDHPAC